MAEENSTSKAGTTQFKSGIYEIVNTVSGKRYVGSAVNFENRWRLHQHRLSIGLHHNSPLQCAWDKYGQEMFTFRLLLICAREHLVFYEQRAIDILCPEYNICRKAGSTFGFKFTEKSRAKIAAKAMGRKRSLESIERGAEKVRGTTHSAERVAHLIGNKHALGMKHTEERKAIISAQQIGLKRPKDAEYRAKISAGLKGKKHTAEQRAAKSKRQKGKKRGPYKPMSPEVRERMVAQRIGKPNPMLGKTHSTETRAKISEALRGKTLSTEKTAKIKANTQGMWDAQKKAGIAGRLAKKQHVYQESIEQT